MATRKKKADIVMQKSNPKVIISAEAAEALSDVGIDAKKEAKAAIKKAKKATKPAVETSWPKVTKGSHLTVTTYENGKTELVWDDEALAREVREAIASVEVKPKKVKKTKAA